MARFVAHTQPDFTLVKGNGAIRDAFGGIDRIPNVLVFSRTSSQVLHFIHHRGAKKTHATEEELDAAVRTALSQASAILDRRIPGQE